MTIALKGERFSQVLTSSAGDNVMFGISLPAESVLKNITARIDIVGTSPSLERHEATAYAVAGYVLGLEDPDSPVPFDSIWDRFVPKYKRIDVIDLDTGSLDSTPFWEPGEAAFEEVFDMGDMPTRLFMRRKMLNFSNPGSSGFRFVDQATPFEPQWYPSDSFNIQVNKPIRVGKPSIILFAIAAPALDATTVSEDGHLLESEWGQIQWVEATLERALIDQLGVKEGGAETPWEESSDLLRKHLAPDIYEQTPDSYVLETYNVYSSVQFEHTVPGVMSFDTVDLTP